MGVGNRAVTCYERTISRKRSPILRAPPVSYLSYLARQGLLTRTAPGYVLTERGQTRLEFFAVTGCDHVECPLCEGKAGYVTCPLCGFRLSRNDARLRPERNFVLVRRPAGVHCPRCLSLILTEDRARLVGITAEAR